MSRIVSNSPFSISFGGRFGARPRRSALVLVAALSLFLASTLAKAACGRFDVPGVKAAVKLPPMAHADFDFPPPFGSPTIVGLWHVIYTAPDQTIFNDTFDTWHADGTEFESAYLAPAAGDVCVGVWRQTGGTIKLHHVGWLFNPSTPTATATNTFTLDEQVNLAPDGKSYSGTFTFKVWNLDGTPTPVEVTGTIAATRITVN